MALRQLPVYKSAEDDILTAMIASTSFLEQVQGAYRPEYFVDYARLIADWVFAYWRDYRQAPGRTIQNIYNVEQANVPAAIAENVATYLGNLSTQYEQTATLNIPYLVNSAQEFFRRRSYEYLFNAGRELIQAGRLDDAIQLHTDFRGTMADTSRWENPLDPAVISEHFSQDPHEFQVLQFHGKLGHLVGPMERSSLVAFMGPMKRGKSFWCEESIFAGISQHRRVAYINLEMPGRSVKQREYKRITGLPDRAGYFVLPQFDCMLNQTGVCNLPCRMGTGILRVGNAPMPHYSAGHPWAACTYCRENRREILRTYGRNSYQAAVWYSRIARQAVDSVTVQARAADYMMLYGDNLRQITFPAYSATVDDVRSGLDELEYVHKFYPDIVVLDYADILASEQSYSQERNRLDNIWKRLKRAAAEMDALWITATQTNRTGLEHYKLSQTDTAEDIRKLAHVDTMLAINRTDEEEHFTRITKMVERNLETPLYQVAVLHQLGLGLPFIDSEIFPVPRKIKKGKINPLKTL